MLEFDYILKSEDENSHIIVKYRLEENKSDVVKFNPNDFGLQGRSNTYPVKIAPDQIYHFQILVLDDQIAVFINDKLIEYSDQPTQASGTGIEFAIHPETGFDASLDNIKFWDLEGVELPNSASRLDPAIQAALDTIQSEEPLYQTSFDDWDTEDTGRNAALVNGKLILTSEDENGATLGLNAYPSDSYAVEFELSILGDASSDSLCVYEAGNGASWGDEFIGDLARNSGREKIRRCCQAMSIN